MFDFRTFSIVTAVAASSLTLVGSPAEAQQVSGAEFTNSHSGKCVTYSGPAAGTQCFGSNGVTNYDDKSYGTDTGRWEVRGNDVCTNWQKEPGWDCGPVSRTGSNSFTDGEYSWTLN